MGRSSVISCLWRSAVLFIREDASAFGSRLAIAPFLYGGAVGKFHWLTEQQFLGAVAVAMIASGPIVISSGFIGYLVVGEPSHDPLKYL